MEPVFDEPSVRAINLSGLNGNVRNIVGLELPARLFGKKRFKARDMVGFTSTFFTHCRAYRVDWNGTFRLVGK